VDNVPQPDALLRLLPECGGRSRVDEEGYLIGPPELVFEICASSASIDLRDKLKVYRRAGILEYLVWRTTEDRFDWLVLESDDYQASPPDARGLICSRAFPGLWLDTTALLNQNSAQVLDALQNGLASSEHQHFAQRLIGLRHSGS
jgi:Uma2 family endonuclease